MSETVLRMEVNDRPVEISVPSHWRLLDVLREKLGLTGTKEGCGEGECGACTVLLNGLPVNACLVLAGSCRGKKVITIEGLEKNGMLHPIQRAFLDHGAVQCGFCTPGMVLSAYALLEENPGPSREEIRVALSGNLCRCTGYQQIIDAVSSLKGEKIQTGECPGLKGAEEGAV